MSSDWLPGKRSDRLNMAKNWVEILKSKDTWGVPYDAVTELVTLTAAAEEAFIHAHSQHRGPMATSQSDEAFAALIPIMRDIKDRYFKNPPLTNPDFISLGLKPRDTIRTSHIDVTEIVEFELIVRNIREIIVNFWIKGASHKAKPKGYDGAVIVWDVLDSPPARPDDLNRHTLASRTPYSLHFDESERGKTVYVALCWQNARGNIGQWSEILSAVVP